MFFLHLLSVFIPTLVHVLHVLLVLVFHLLHLLLMLRLHHGLHFVSFFFLDR